MASIIPIFGKAKPACFASAFTLPVVPACLVVGSINIGADGPALLIMPCNPAFDAVTSLFNSPTGLVDTMPPDSLGRNTVGELAVTGAGNEYVFTGIGL